MDFAKVTMVGHLKGSMKGDEEIRIYNMYNIYQGCSQHRYKGEK